MNFMPVAVAELESRFWFEDRIDWPTSIVNREGNGSIQHFQNQIVSPTLDSKEYARNVSWFDLHDNVEVQADEELFGRDNPTSIRSKKVEPQSPFHPFSLSK